MNDTIIGMTKFRRAMRPFTLLLYYLVMEDNMQNVLETGCNQAQSTRAILSAMKEKNSGKLYSVDLKDGTHRIPDELKSYWNMVKGDSTKVDTIKKVNNKVYDMVLIDGGHFFPVPELDFINFAPLVKEGGFILLHDIINQNCDVPSFWNKIDNNVWNKIELPFGRIAGLGICQKKKIT
jgi:predicted O-methyltransferase YrrM